MSVHIAITPKQSDMNMQTAITATIPSTISISTSTTLRRPKVDSQTHFKTFCSDVGMLLNGLNHPHIMEHISQLDSSIIQSTLPRLDDYTALFEAFRTSSISLEQELSLIQKHTVDQVPHFIERVNRLDEYVTNVEACCVELDKRMSQAEDAYVSHSALSTAGLAKIFSSVTNQSSPLNPSMRVSTEPIEIVSSSDYIYQSQTTTTQTAQV